MFFNGRYRPICGHFFWDNNIGATLFCQQLNGNSYKGKVTRRTDITLESDALSIGKCNEGDQLLSCSGGCNENELGSLCADCDAGSPASIEIACFTGKY